MQSSDKDNERRILTLAELARAMHGSSNAPAPPDFAAEGTKVDPQVRTGNPPRRKRAAEPRRKPAKLVLGLGVVEAAAEVPEDLVRSGNLEMSALAEAYRQKLGTAAISDRGPRVGRPRFDDGGPTGAATLMLPPMRRPDRDGSGVLTLLLSAVFAAALITGTAAVTMYALGADSGSKPATANVEPATAPATAEPLPVSATVEPLPMSATADLREKNDSRASRSAELERIRDVEEERRIRDDSEPTRTRRATQRSRKWTAAVPRSCGAQTCLVRPSLACCQEAVAE